MNGFRLDLDKRRPILASVILRVNLSSCLSVKELPCTEAGGVKVETLELSPFPSHPLRNVAWTRRVQRRHGQRSAAHQERHGSHGYGRHFPHTGRLAIQCA